MSNTKCVYCNSGAPGLVQFCGYCCPASERDALRAENARLRAAIVEYASAAEQFVGPTNGRYAAARDALLRIAGEDGHV